VIPAAPSATIAIDAIAHRRTDVCHAFANFGIPFIFISSDPLDIVTGKMVRSFFWLLPFPDDMKHAAGRDPAGVVC
jgi:hypothetical protein